MHKKINSEKYLQTFLQRDTIKPLISASLVAQIVKNLPAMQELQELLVWSLVWENPLEKGMAPTQYSCLENFMDRVAWQAIVHRVTKSRNRLITHTCICMERRRSLNNYYMRENSDPNSGLYTIIFFLKMEYLRIWNYTEYKCLAYIAY